MVGVEGQGKELGVRSSLIKGSFCICFTVYVVFMPGHTSPCAEACSAATATWASWVGSASSPLLLSPVARIASNLFFLMTAYSLPHPTANTQAYTVKLTQKGSTLFALWQ